MAEERISYRMPSCRYRGWLVFFAAFKNHNSFVVPGRSVMEFGRELRPFEVSGKTIHFTAGHPLPARLVRKIVKQRIKENETDS